MQYGVYYGTERVSEQKIKRYMRKCILIVVRHNMANSKPCLHCLRKIKSYGIKKVYYSFEGTLIRENAFKMTTNHVSSGYRKNKAF